jgi:Predicted transcriptional regulators
MNSEHEKNAKVFKALCDPCRLAVLEQLRSGEKCACVLLEKLQIGQSGLSYHMKILCESGIVESWQEGKWTHYRLSESGRETAVGLLCRLTTPDAEQNENFCRVK